MSNLERIDETTARRPEWVEGFRVVLSDGQSWSFPRPRLALLSASEVVWTLEGRPDPGFGEAFETAAFGILADDDPDSVVGFAIQIAGMLLMRNYLIDGGQAVRLLTAWPSEEATIDALNAIKEAVIQPACDDIRRTRRGITPADETGNGVFGLN